MAFVTHFPLLRTSTNLSSTDIRTPPTIRRSRTNFLFPCATAKMPIPEEPQQASPITQDFLLTLAGVYASMGTAPAFALPDTLVEAFKSIPASLAHPITMWVLFGTCSYAFYLGYQSRSIRTAPVERRKELVKLRVTERHHKLASGLFAVMTLATFSGMANTFARTEKLFPGPHLYAGLGLVATMVVMQAFVPYMQKGKNWARQIHFSMAFLALGLFGWQAKSGMDIVAKLLKWD